MPNRGYDRHPRRRARGGNFKLRILIAAGIVVFSLLSYYRMSVENPVTGQRQRVAMTEAQEVQLGLAATPEMQAQHGGLHPDRRGHPESDFGGLWWAANDDHRGNRLRCR